MNEAKIALLPDRGVVSVTGEDARKLLVGITTNDINLLDTQPAIYAGLLSPQGKVLFDFLVSMQDGSFFLDVAAEKAAELTKRLLMYRLRAKADIRDESGKLCVLTMWGKGVRNDCNPGFADPRHTALGLRIVSDLRSAADDIACSNGIETSEADYHAHRISLGIPEGGKDYDYGDAFPHEANFDLINGVSFDKGCYVGQEIVARMQHRGTVRKRVVRVHAPSELPATRPDVMMGDVAIGRMGSVAGKIGLAMLRLDRVIEGLDKGVPITAGGIALEVDPEMVAGHRQLMAERMAPP